MLSQDINGEIAEPFKNHDSKLPQMFCVSLIVKSTGH